MWGSIICFTILSWLFYLEYERVIASRCLFDVDKHNCGGQRAILFRMLCFVTAFGGMCYFVYVLTLFNKINLGIGLIKAATQVVKVLSQIRFFSIIVVAVGMFFSVFIFYVAIYGLTIGVISVEDAKDIDGRQAKVYTPSSIAQMTLAYPGFMLVFLLTFLLQVNEMFIAYSLSVWFFTKKKETVQVEGG